MLISKKVLLILTIILSWPAFSTAMLRNLKKRDPADLDESTLERAANQARKKLLDDAVLLTEAMASADPTNVTTDADKISSKKEVNNAKRRAAYAARRAKRIKDVDEALATVGAASATVGAALATVDTALADPTIDQTRASKISSAREILIKEKERSEADRLKTKLWRAKRRKDVDEALATIDPASATIDAALATVDTVLADPTIDQTRASKISSARKLLIKEKARKASDAARSKTWHQKNSKALKAAPASALV
jgi:hypothetical protein